jgi:hypothetical protein
MEQEAFGMPGTTMLFQLAIPTNFGIRHEDHSLIAEDF